MAFCWNGALEVLQTLKYPDMNFRILPMAFPSGSGEPRLQYGIWGFGVFDNHDEARLAAAKELIRFLTGSDSQYSRAVQATNFWPVREMGEYNEALTNANIHCNSPEPPQPAAVRCDHRCAASLTD